MRRAGARLSVAVACVALALAAGCSTNDVGTGDGGGQSGTGGSGQGGHASGGTGGVGGSCAGAGFTCAYGSDGVCGDVVLPAVCRGGQWACGQGQIRLSQCRCAGLTQQACSCGDAGWVCPDAGAGGSAGGGGRGGSGAAGSGGSAGRGGSGAGGQGTAGRGGAGGAATALPCPAAVPRAGDACSTAQACYYEDCAVAGRAIARCPSGQWTLETGACADYRCGDGGPTCSAGQICVIRQGGARFFDCRPNGCGSGAVTCGCVQSCETSCYMSGSASSGFTLTCDICGLPPCA